MKIIHYIHLEASWKTEKLAFKTMMALMYEWICMTSPVVAVPAGNSDIFPAFLTLFHLFVFFQVIYCD